MNIRNIPRESVPYSKLLFLVFFLFLYSEDAFTNYPGFLTLLWIVGVLFYIVIIVDIAYCICTKNVDITNRKTQTEISSMTSLQIICFIIIMMSIYDIFINSFDYHSCIQALQYLTPAVYLLIDAFVFNQLIFNISDIENTLLFEDLV